MSKIMKFGRTLIVMMLVLSLFGSFTCQAAQTYMVDDEGVLTQEELDALEEGMQNISDYFSCDVAMVFAGPLNGQDIEVAADQYLTANVGYGSTSDGILLYMSLSDGMYAIRTSGAAMQYFPDAALSAILEQTLPCIQEQRYYDGCKAYADACDYFLESYFTESNWQEGSTSANASSSDYYGWDSSSTRANTHNPIWAAISALVGLITGKAATSGEKSALTSVQSQSGARTYVRENGFKVTDAHENYLYSTVVAMPLSHGREEGQNGQGYGQNGHGSGQNSGSSYYPNMMSTSGSIGGALGSQQASHHSSYGSGNGGSGYLQGSGGRGPAARPPRTGSAHRK